MKIRFILCLPILFSCLTLAFSANEPAGGSVDYRIEEMAVTRDSLSRALDAVEVAVGDSAFVFIKTDERTGDVASSAHRTLPSRAALGEAILGDRIAGNFPGEQVVNIPEKSRFPTLSEINSSLTYMWVFRVAINGGTAAIVAASKNLAKPVLFPRLRIAGNFLFQGFVNGGFMAGAKKVNNYSLTGHPLKADFLPVEEKTFGAILMRAYILSLLYRIGITCLSLSSYKGYDAIFDPQFEFGLDTLQLVGMNIFAQIAFSIKTLLKNGSIRIKGSQKTEFGDDFLFNLQTFGLGSFFALGITFLTTDVTKKFLNVDLPLNGNLMWSAAYTILTVGGLVWLFTDQELINPRGLSAKEFAWVTAQEAWQSCKDFFGSVGGIFKRPPVPAGAGG